MIRDYEKQIENLKSMLDKFMQDNSELESALELYAEQSATYQFDGGERARETLKRIRSSLKDKDKDLFNIDRSEKYISD